MIPADEEGEYRFVDQFLVHHVGHDEVLAGQGKAKANLPIQRAYELKGVLFLKHLTTDGKPGHLESQRGLQTQAEL